MEIYRNTFRKEERLCRKKDIDLLFESGKRFYLAPLKVLFSFVPAGAEPIARLLLVVPKKNFRNASDRNRIKRLLREAYRIQKYRLIELLQEPKLNLNIAVVYTSKNMLVYSEALDTINRMIIKLTENKGKS